MNRAVRRNRPCMSSRKLEWSHTPASTAGWSICSSNALTPPTIIVVTSPWTRQATDAGPNNPSGRRSIGRSPRAGSLKTARTQPAIACLIIRRIIGRCGGTGRIQRREASGPQPPIASIAGRGAANGEDIDEWRPEPESNRRARICSPLRNHSAIGPMPARLAGRAHLAAIARRRNGTWRLPRSRPTSSA